MTVILQTIKGKQKTRTEYDDWPDAMTDGSFIAKKDSDATVSIFLKGSQFDV